MNQADILIWVSWILCLGLSFVLSGMEAGVFALNTLRIQRQVRSGRKSARMLHGFLQNPERFLWTIFVANTLVNFFALAWVFSLLHGGLSHKPVWLLLAAGAVVFAFYTLLDLLPKVLFRKFPNRLCLALAGPVRFLHLVMKPLVTVVEVISAVLLGGSEGRAFTGQLFATREEMRAVMQESGKGFTPDERVMINRVLDLQSITVRQILKPMQLAVTANMENTLESVLAACRDHGFTRYPVWDLHDGRRRVVGILNLDDVLYRPDLELSGSIARFVKPAVFVDENLPLEKALRKMRHSGQQLAVVLGRGQREIGILSLQDVLRQVFGEVEL